jgi:fatty-acid desaturase
MVLWWISGSLGVGMGYHRLLTHRGYKTPKWVEYFLTACGTLALESGPIAWAATHRVHHQNARTPTRKAIRTHLETADCGPMWAGS